MGSAWLMNFLQLPQVGMKPSEVVASLSDIPHPHVEMAIHHTFKTTQTSIFVGSVIVAPIYCLCKYRLRGYRFPPGALWRYMKRCGAIGAGVGLVSGIPVSLILTRNLPYDQIWLRCRQLRMDVFDLHTNRVTLYSSLVGLFLGRLGGFIVGHNVSLLFALTYNKFAQTFQFKDYVRSHNFFEDLRDLKDIKDN